MSNSEHANLSLCVLIVGALLSLSSIILTLYYTTNKAPKNYYFCRYGLMTSGFCFGTLLQFCWGLSIFLAVRTLEPWMTRVLWAGISSSLVPISIGFLAGLGTKSPIVVGLGRGLIFGLLPMICLWLSNAYMLDDSKTQFTLMLLGYSVITAIWWEALVHWERKLQEQ